MLLALWFGPLAVSSRYSFAAHMTIHIGVVAFASAGLALGIAGTRFDPSRRFAAAFSPLIASFVDLAIIWIWHLPSLHEWTRSSTAGFVLEQLCFLFGGMWLWLSAFGGQRKSEQSRNRRASGVAGLLLTSMHMTLLGALLALTPRALFPSELVCTGEAWALDDQQLGGTIMLLGGGIAYLAGGLGLTACLLREKQHPTETSLYS
ncbi:cytochrome c oxidase assembly protein [Pelagicoccus sp. SDUM812002]|uniref:cytochrome c oxidase assembly protein n=1 Tax=Pelagicoccus sp. SDUM812002 TaxID=3041266 RepID=UPI00281237A9|nr:cytochrome c oxidase assembly protein [Pelagicoccus sp. SDUM812002]